jgi:hypothetical protein
MDAERLVPVTIPLPASLHDLLCRYISTQQNTRPSKNFIVRSALESYLAEQGICSLPSTLENDTLD